PAVARTFNCSIETMSAKLPLRSAPVLGRRNGLNDDRFVFAYGFGAGISLRPRTGALRPAYNALFTQVKMMVSTMQQDACPTAFVEIPVIDFGLRTLDLGPWTRSTSI